MQFKFYKTADSYTMCDQYNNTIIWALQLCLPDLAKDDEDSFILDEQDLATLVERCNVLNWTVSIL